MKQHNKEEYYKTSISKYLTKEQYDSLDSSTISKYIKKDESSFLDTSYLSSVAILLANLTILGLFAFGIYDSNKNSSKDSEIKKEIQFKESMLETTLKK